MQIMKFDVMFSSHDMLKMGITDADRVRVVVAADSFFDGQIMAAQFAMTLQTMRGRPANMPTATLPII